MEIYISISASSWRNSKQHTDTSLKYSGIYINLSQSELQFRNETILDLSELLYMHPNKALKFIGKRNRTVNKLTVCHNKTNTHTKNKYTDF